MLLRRADLEGIVAGRITLCFRRWKRPTVKSGGSLRTAVGVLAIRSVREVSRSRITAREALAAGYGSRRELLEELDRREGTIHRIELAYAGADPRLELRERAELTPEELKDLRERLERLDRASRDGPWTRRVLTAIRTHPHQAARDLAARLGLERDRLKPNVRKLKNLGLTVSHHPGYALSPRGEALLKHLGRR